MPFVNIGGVTLHYRLSNARGGGLPIVFINSLGTDLRIWDAVAALLGETVPVLAYDKRGHGLSDLGRGIRDMDDHVTDLAGLLDHLGLNGAAVCGLSVGGLIAQRLHAWRPDLTVALILAGTAPKIGTAESWAARIATIERGGIAAISEGVLKGWFTPAFHEKRAAEVAGCRNMLERQSVPGYVGTCAALAAADYTDAARKIAVPTLCLGGDQDGTAPPHLMRSMADLIPGARFEIIRDAAHIPCIERPEAFAALVHAFLASLPFGAQAHA